MVNKIFLYPLFILILVGCSSTQISALSSGVKAVNNSLKKTGGYVNKSCLALSDDPGGRYSQCFFDEADGSCDCFVEGTTHLEQVY